MVNISSSATTAMEPEKQAMSDSETTAIVPYVEFSRQLVSSTDKECTYEAKRKSHPKSFQLQYTIQDAELAQLTRPTKSGKPSNWMKRPKEQLRKTCGAQISRVVAPGAAIGLYRPEELGYED